MKKLQVTITGELPADEFDRAAVLTRARGPIDAFVKALMAEEIAVSVHTKLFTAKPQKAARKPKAEALSGV